MTWTRFLGRPSRNSIASTSPLKMTDTRWKGSRCHLVASPGARNKRRTTVVPRWCTVSSIILLPPISHSPQRTPTCIAPKPPFSRSRRVRFRLKIPDGMLFSRAVSKVRRIRRAQPTPKRLASKRRGRIHERPGIAPSKTSLRRQAVPCLRLAFPTIQAQSAF